MSLGRQWDERIRIWTEYLPRFFFTECGSCEAKFFTTKEHLPYSEVVQKEMVDAPEGLAWGSKWEYAWFSFSVKLPKSVCGKRIVIRPDTGGESLVFVNGKACGAFDKKHDFITLTPKAKEGDVFNIVVESYAGHGLRAENGGPYAVDEVPIPEPPEKQVKVGHICWGVWNEEVYQTYIDEFVLYRLLSVLPENSLRAQKIAKALKEFTLIADYELPEPERTKSILKAREVLKDELLCVNGSTAPVMSIFGQSHLDLAWLWPLEETKRKCARTFSNQISLMDEYSEYCFLACEPFLLELLNKYYPDVFNQLCEKYKKNQIFADGVFWVESDVNIPCGEALIRQIVLGKKYFKKVFNSDSEVAWLPDTFGFSAALPQILKGCGAEYFATQKLLRCDPECEQFPFNNFWWEGIDGTRILSHVYKKNNAVLEPASVWERWNKDRNQKEDIDGMMFPFGYGDGGGGATRTMLECARRMNDLEGLPKIRYESPNDFFERIKTDSKNPVKNVYSGELYLAWHRGTYTSQAKIKRYSRQAENSLHCAEFWNALSFKTDLSEKINENWQKLLFCQFHDVLPGTSIKRVCDEAENDLQNVILDSFQIAENCGKSLLNKTEKKQKQSFALNTLSWPRTELIELEDSKYVTISVPPCGFAEIESSKLLTKSLKSVFCQQKVEKEKTVFELRNDFIKIIINENGELSSVFDYENRTELCSDLCNSFKMYKDVTPFYDAWELSPMYKDCSVELEKKAKISVIEEQDDFVKIKIQKKLNNSEMTQIITMKAKSRRVDFETIIDWKEKHKILKVDFPLAIQTNEAISETQFGFEKRSVNTSHQYEKDMYEVCNHRYTALADANHGAALLNDCKYGISVQNRILSLSLLRSPVVPDMYADLGIQKMTYSLYVFNKSFEESDTVREAYNLNSPLQIIKSDFAVDEKQKSFFSIDNRHLVLETVKLSDNKQKNIVLRFYEASGGTQDGMVTINFPFKTYCLADLSENLIAEKVINSDGKFNLHFKPFEIKTIILEI